MKGMMIRTVLVLGLFVLLSFSEPPHKRPNILFMIADDWGWPHSPMYGDRVVKTPTFDRLAREGILFEHAYVSSPSCTPSRSALLTGQYHWRLGEAANLWSTLDADIPTYPLLLQQAGYFVGSWRKCWGPGDIRAGGYTDTDPGGPVFDGFKDFLDHRPADRPFCFWLGSPDPHRGYKLNSGRDSGIPVDSIRVPAIYPDVDAIRSDIADYYYAVERFDSDCAEALRLLEERGELDNTIIVMTGDNGFPFPRAKSNLYDLGVREPLAIRWGVAVKPGRTVTDFISFTDFAPTFLELAGVEIPKVMTGKSFAKILRSRRNGRIDPTRDAVFVGKERHVPAQLSPSLEGYPCRSIRTDKWQYIYNFKPDLWPAGVPDGATHPSRRFADCDNGPTKDYIMKLADDRDLKKYFDWSFGKRPQEELYDMEKDPDELHNLAGLPEYQQIRDKLKKRLFDELKATRDPRVMGNGDVFDEYPYRAGYKLRE